jgi:phage replication-related protein YjqB (UPF0714/DUF867 family)
MVAHRASIRKTLPSQEDLRRRREHCSADPRKLLEIGSDLGYQVRIMGSVDDHVLYTVSEVVDEDPDGIVRMGQSGRERLGTAGEFEGVIDSQVPHPTLTDAQAAELGEFVERLRDGHSSTLIALGPHGGGIEPHTDEQAERVATRLAGLGASSWICKGYKPDGNPFRSWHITSDDIEPKSFPLLNSVAARGFSDAVSFHGFDEPLVLVGGRAPIELRDAIRSAIADAIADPEIVVRVATPDEPFNGDDPCNIVNRITANGQNGVQIEQSLPARTKHWDKIADAVADVYAARLRRPSSWSDRVHSLYARLRQALRRLVSSTDTGVVGRGSIT